MTAPFGPRAGGLQLIRLVLVAVALGTAANSVVTVLLYRAHNARANQLCDLVIATHADRVKRLVNTLDYLKTPAGQQHTALNDYIRAVSLPQTQAEIAKERSHLPKSCVAGRKLPAIPRTR